MAARCVVSGGRIGKVPTSRRLSGSRSFIGAETDGLAARKPAAFSIVAVDNLSFDILSVLICSLRVSILFSNTFLSWPVIVEAFVWLFEMVLGVVLL
jgi:ABC-type microcin C transport system permease subunit YejE